MTEIKLELFTFKGFELRAVNLEGQPYFVGKDVAELLGYSNPQKAMRDHIDSEDKVMGERNVTPSIVDKIGREQYPTLINESGLYSLILKSKLPEAKEFKRWVTSEVLPQIRMTGGYVPVEKEDTEEEIMAKAFLIAQRTIEKKEEIIKQKDQQLKEQAPKVEFHDDVLTADGTHTITSIASDYGWSGKTMNDKLHAMKIQYKQSGRWYLYQNHKNKGYTESSTYVTKGKFGSKTQMKWTNKGRYFIYKQLKQHGINPNQDNLHKYVGVGKAAL